MHTNRGVPRTWECIFNNQSNSCSTQLGTDQSKPDPSRSLFEIPLVAPTHPLRADSSSCAQVWSQDSLQRHLTVSMLVCHSSVVVCSSTKMSSSRQSPEAVVFLSEFLMKSLLPASVVNRVHSLLSDPHTWSSSTILSHGVPQLPLET